MTRYKEFQTFNLLLAFLIHTHILLGILFFVQSGTRPIDLNGFVIQNVIIGLSYLFFYGMTNSITDEKITIQFGIGIIWRNIELTNIASVVTVRNPWYYGWGIRLIPNGMLYNIGGFEAVELKLKSSGRVVRIGTKNPVQLRNEIVKRLAPQT